MQVSNGAKNVEPGYRAPDLTLVGEDHLKKYLETDGEVGYMWNDAPILVLTTTGKRSGKLRQIPIIFATDGDNHILVASNGGSPTHPGWYHNLCAEPKAQLQVKGKKIDVIARTAKSPEREKLWKIAASIWPNYDVYTTRTTREIPVVVLEPVK